MGDEVPGEQIAAQEEEDVEPAAGVCMPMGQGEQDVDSGDEAYVPTVQDEQGFWPVAE